LNMDTLPTTAQGWAAYNAALPAFNSATDHAGNGIDIASIRDAYLRGDYGLANGLISRAGLSQAGATNAGANLGYTPADIESMKAHGITFAAGGTPAESVGWNTNARWGDGSLMGSPVPVSSTPTASAGGGGGSSGGVSSADINGWLSSHPGASDPQIAQAMQQYGVSPQQMAGAIGADPSYIQNRYNAATGAGAMGGHGDPHNGHQVGGIGGAGGVMGTMGGPAGGVAGYGAGTGNTGNFGNFSQNPYLSSMADEIGRRTQLGLTDSFNQIRGDAVGTGGLGGSRQGVAQGVATGRAMDSLQGNLAGLFGGQYNADANRGLQQYQGDQQFYNSGRALDQSGAALGANIYNMGVQGGYTPLNQANGIYSQYTGFGTNNGTSSQGGGAMGAVGGALGAAQLYSNLNKGSGSYGGWGSY
jgi:hypothetical protein